MASRMNSSKLNPFSMANKGSKFTFNGNNVPSGLSLSDVDEKQPSPSVSSTLGKASSLSSSKGGSTLSKAASLGLSMKARLSINHDFDKESNSAASTPRLDAESGDNGNDKEEQRGGGGNKEDTMLSPSILHRKPVGSDEIDDGNKSDGGSNSNSGNGINFKEAVSKMKLFGKSMQKLIKSTSEPQDIHGNGGKNAEFSESKQMERTVSESSCVPYHQPHHNPNQILRFMKKANIHCDDISWIHDCKYAQCSRKYRTLYED